MTIEPASPEPAAIDAHIAALLADALLPPPARLRVCALSGGPDSAALVALAVAADLDVRTVHVDHGLRPSSADDASIAQGDCGPVRRAIPMRTRRSCRRCQPRGTRRAARRAAVGAGALTGHTADDQAETLLLRLLRGAGGAGLAAMSPGPTKPILALRRTETHELCTLLDLKVADDPTNTDRRFRRNRMRHDVIPLLNDVADRDVTALLTRSSTLLREDEAVAEPARCELDPTDARGLAAAPLPLARRSVRQWILSATVDDLTTRSTVIRPTRRPSNGSSPSLAATPPGATLPQDGASSEQNNGYDFSRTAPTSG